MNAPQVASGGFTFSQVSTGGTWFWTVTSTNIQGANQLYQVTNIVTPFGNITDAIIPIPGDIIAAMYNSLQQFQQQLAPLLALVSPNPAIFSLTVTEGDSSSTVGSVIIQNIGAFGSFMTATATPDVPWLSASPATIPGIDKNQQARFNISINPATMLAANSPYVGHVNIQDNRTPPTIIPATVNVTVLPRSNILVSPIQINLTWSLSAQVGNGSQQLTVSNNGPAGSQLTFTVAKVQNVSPWLTFSPQSGGPLAQNVSSIITCSLVQLNIPQSPGTYNETLLVSSYSASNNPISVMVTLVVTA